MVAADPILLNDWHPVAKVEDCPPGKILTARLLGEDLVLWRPLDPEAPVQAWLDRCPHRGAPLSLGKVCLSTLACVYHGWEYDTTGKCVLIPSHPALEPPEKARIETYHCRERYGAVWVCLGNPSADVPSFPEWDEPNCHRFCCDPYLCNASAFRMIENELDISHFPFLHSEFLVEGNHTRMQVYGMEMNKHELTIRSRQALQSVKDGTSLTGATVLQRICRPLTLYYGMELPEKGKIAAITAVTPIEEEKCMMWAMMVTDSSEAALYYGGVQGPIALQDIFMLERQRPARLPLLPRGDADRKWPEELHVPSDRASVAYRKWLKELGVTYGVC